MRSYMGSRSQEQASRSSKHTIRNRILWIETLFYHFSMKLIYGIKISILKEMFII